MFTMFDHEFEKLRAWVRREVRCELAQLGLIHETVVDAPPVIQTPVPTPSPFPVPEPTVQAPPADTPTPPQQAASEV